MYVLESSKMDELPARLIRDMLQHGFILCDNKGNLSANPIFFTDRDINNVVDSENNAVKAQNSSQEDNIYVEVIHFLNQEAKTRYRANVQATQRLIKARVKEGFTLDDFKTVIHTKCKEWGKDPKMKKYIRPSTLFAPTKFESYLNQAEPYKEKQPERQEQPNLDDRLTLYDVDMNW